MSKVTLKGEPVKILGLFPSVGDTVANVTLTNKDLADVTFADYDGKRKILNIFPSIDTGVCATSVRQFNERASGLDNAVVLCISADLPFAQGRFCGAEGLSNVEMLSSFRHKDSREKLGVDIASMPLAGLMARAVIVVDENNKVLHCELVDEIGSEPNYSDALAVL